MTIYFGVDIPDHMWICYGCQGYEREMHPSRITEEGVVYTVTCAGCGRTTEWVEHDEDMEDIMRLVEINEAQLGR